MQCTVHYKIKDGTCKMRGRKRGKKKVRDGERIMMDRGKERWIGNGKMDGWTKEGTKN